MNNTDKNIIRNIFRQKYPQELIDLTDNPEVDIWRTIQHQVLIFSDPKPNTFNWTTYQEFEGEVVTSRFQNLFCKATRRYWNLQADIQQREQEAYYRLYENEI